MRCTCGQTNMICRVHPPLGAPTNSFVAAADFADSMELISSKELADLRERLRQREAELEQRWIAVEDKLPDAEGKVLVLRSNDHPKIDLEWYTKRGRWDSGFFHDGEQDTNVTHWQPLPSPPKESAKNVGERSTS